MNLDDLQKPMSASAISKLLKKHYGLQAPIEEMSNKQAKKILENVQAKLSKIRNSKMAHLAEKHQSYNALLLTEQMLSKKINENKYGDAFGPATGTLGSDIGQAFNAVGQSIRSIPGANVSSPVSQASVLDIFRSAVSSIKTARSQVMGEYQKIIKSNNLTVDEFEKYFKQFENTQKADHIPVEKQEDFFDALSAIQWKIEKMQGKNRDLNAIVNALNSTFRSRNTARTTASAPPPTNAPPAGAPRPVGAAGTGVSESNMRYQQFKAKKRKIYESAMSEAEVVLAAKDIADRFQDMVESLGKMVNEELPALAETIRDSMGAEQADAYNASAVETINSALENVRTAKDSLDSAARVLAGEEAGAVPTEPGAEPTGDEQDPEASGGEELDQVPAAASGGEEEPLGRGER